MNLRGYLFVAMVGVLGGGSVGQAVGGPGQTACVLRSGLPGEDARLVSALVDQVQAAGYAAREITLQDICDSERLNADLIDLLVLADGGSLPMASSGPIVKYLQQGGDIIAMNTPLWQRGLIQNDGQWTTREELSTSLAATPVPNLFVHPTDELLKSWKHSTSATDGPGRCELVPNALGGQPAIHIVSEKLDNWDTWVTPVTPGAFPAGQPLTVFSAKGSEKTSQLSLEWEERDGSRWIAVVPLSTQWQRYVLTPSDFRYWQSNPARGQSGDCLKPENVVSFHVGLAMSHTTGLVRGQHEYWLAFMGTAPDAEPHRLLVGQWSQPVLDTLSPSYKLFDCNQVKSLVSQSEQIVFSGRDFEIPKVIRSPHPRARGAGFDKQRSWRWIPLLEARAADGQWRGTPATLTLHTDGPFKGGLWASFGIDDPAWYSQPVFLEGFRRLARNMRTGLFILDGGADHFTYFPDQPLRLGARVFNASRVQRSGELKVKVIDGGTSKQIYDEGWEVRIPPGDVQKVETSWKPTSWPAEDRVTGFQSGLICTVELVTDKVLVEDVDTSKAAAEIRVVIDRVAHDVHLWQPAEHKRFVYVKNGGFSFGRNRWRIHGVNYMPSSGIATDDHSYFEYWLGSQSYDPEVIDRDLKHIQDLGMNAVSIFIYRQSMEAQNLLDFLRRAREKGLRVNLSLRPGTPMDFQWPAIRDLLEFYRIKEHDEVIALDLAWEPTFGTHEDRRIWDGEWAKWVVERYGSIEAAEKDWGCSIPRDDKGTVTNPSAIQIDTDGDWRVMVAAYRRFLDTLLYAKYSAARWLVRSVDPNHLVSFRMADAANPTYRWDGRMTYDFPYLAAAVDIFEPEAYGRIGNWENVRAGVFEVAYARWAAPDKPVIWAEAGVHTWDVSRMTNAPQSLKFQAEFYRDLYRMLTMSNSDGIFFWWYPGGFRVGENSDYGLINPDGSDRPVTRVVRSQKPSEWSERGSTAAAKAASKTIFLHTPPPQPVDTWIEMDRDRHPSGVTAIYEQVAEPFWKAIAAGKTPGLRTAGTGTTSANCPALAVGNRPWTGTNPPKFLDAYFDAVEVQGTDGQWITVEKGATIKAKRGVKLVARVLLTNLGESSWLASSLAATVPAASQPSPLADGTVVVTARIGKNGPEMTSPIPTPVAHLENIQIESVMLLPSGWSEPTELTLYLTAVNRTSFGERFGIRVEPQP